VGLNFAVYESLKDWLVKSNPFGIVQDSELSVTTRLACGAAAGTMGQTVAYPLDVIRRRMQMVGWNHAASVVAGDGRGKVPLEYSGMVDAFRKTVRYEGFGALYKGLVPNSVKVRLSPVFINYVTFWKNVGKTYVHKYICNASVERVRFSFLLVLLMYYIYEALKTSLFIHVIRMFSVCDSYIILCWCYFPD